MKVKILNINNDSISEKEIGEIVDAKRFYELTKDEIEESVGKIDTNDTLWEIDDIFIHEKDNYWVYMLDDDVEIIEE